MSETALDIRGTTTLDPIALIWQSDRADSTKTQYTRALKPYLDQGGNLADVPALAAYAKALGKSRRAHLRSAVSVWAKETETLLKATATPETLDKTQAAIMRLEALPEVIQVETPKGKKAHTWLSPRQVQELAQTCSDDLLGLRDKVVLALLVGAGLRRQELADLTWEHVKLQPCDGAMTTVLGVHGKGAKDRAVPLKPEIAAILDKWAEVTGRQGHIARSLGRGQRLGDRLSAVSIFKIVRRHGAMIGLPELAAHDLRRTFAQLIWDDTHDLLLVSELLGHSSIETTRRYLTLNQGKKAEAVKAIPFG